VSDSTEELILKLGDCIKDAATLAATVTDDGSAQRASPKLQEINQRHQQLINELRGRPKLPSAEYHALMRSVQSNARYKDSLRALEKENARLQPLAFATPPTEAGKFAILAGGLVATPAMLMRLEDKEARSTTAKAAASAGPPDLSVDNLVIRLSGLAKDAAATLATVTDEASATAALPKLQALEGGFKLCTEEFRAHPKLSAADHEAMVKRLQAQPQLLEPVSALAKEMERLRPLATPPKNNNITKVALLALSFALTQQELAALKEGATSGPVGFPSFSNPSQPR